MSVKDGAGGEHALAPHAHVREDDAEYLIHLDVPGLTERELCVEVVGHAVKVRHASLEETFALPDDADPRATAAVYRRGTLELRVPRVHLNLYEIPIEHDWSVVDPDAEAV